MPHRNLLLFFGRTYFPQGLADTLIHHSTRLSSEVERHAAHHAAQVFAFIAMPWIVKPLYGLISDSIPLFGYRRKSYLIGALFLIHEPRVALNAPLFSSIGRHAGIALRSRRVWIVAGFLAFWNVTPNFSLPLFYHMTDQLQFKQGFIGQHQTVDTTGVAVGVYAYRKYLVGAIPVRSLLVLSITLSAATAFTYLLLTGRTSATVACAKCSA